MYKHTHTTHPQSEWFGPDSGRDLMQQSMAQWNVLKPAASANTTTFWYFRLKIKWNGRDEQPGAHASRRRVIWSFPFFPPFFLIFIYLFIFFVYFYFFLLLCVLLLFFLLLSTALTKKKKKRGLLTACLFLLFLCAEQWVRGLHPKIKESPASQLKWATNGSSSSRRPNLSHKVIHIWSVKDEDERHHWDSEEEENRNISAAEIVQFRAAVK